MTTQSKRTGKGIALQGVRVKVRPCGVMPLLAAHLHAVSLENLPRIRVDFIELVNQNLGTVCITPFTTSADRRSDPRFHDVEQTGDFIQFGHHFSPFPSLTAPVWRRADALIPALPSIAGAPSTDCSAQTASSAAPCSWPDPGSAPSRSRTAASPPGTGAPPWLAHSP